ncbi:filamentous hemagglutinin N-terminal domain-containing protein [Cupriavidus sp. D39]|nr:filamentous hemagglutinin N-terminal domain-containing protein [Cupriavidus sp. D39]
MVITQSTPRAAIDWHSFNVGAGNTVQFAQPSTSAQVLNRVVGLTGTSQILGTITANGQVYIVNPQGVVFGKGAVVNTGALLATTRGVDPASFMAGGANTLLLAAGSNGSSIIQNDGNLSAAPGGWIVLAGDQVRNTGNLRAPCGTVALAAGDQATLALANGQMVSLTLGAASANATIDNTGVIQASDGRVWIAANAAGALLNNVINLSGMVDVSGRQAAGHISIDGGLAGTVNVSGAVLYASSAMGVGGNVTISGQTVGLYGSAINATGANGGGTVLVGGGAHGQDLLVHNAQTSVMDAASVIDASAGSNGRGGTVVLWSDHETRVYGTIAARGGMAGGDGGTVETSSHGNLRFAPAAPIDLHAPRGAWGTLLLDPLNIVITHGSADSNTPTTVNALSSSTNGTLTDADLVNALTSGSVVMSATNNISDSSGVTVTSSNVGSSLTFNSVNAVLIGNYGVTGGLIFNTSGQNSIVSGVISGTGGLSQIGTGTVTLSNAQSNTYTGNTTVSAGTLVERNGAGERRGLDPRAIPRLLPGLHSGLIFLQRHPVTFQIISAISV